MVLAGALIVYCSLAYAIIVAPILLTVAVQAGSNPAITTLAKVAVYTAIAVGVFALPAVSFGIGMYLIVTG